MNGNASIKARAMSSIFLGLGVFSICALIPSKALAQGTYEFTRTTNGALIGEGSFSVQDPIPQVSISRGNATEWRASFAGTSLDLLQDAGTLNIGADTSWIFRDFTNGSIISGLVYTGSDSRVSTSFTPNSILIETPLINVAQGEPSQATYNFIITTTVPQAPVPAPIPALAAAGCFGWSRKLRARTKAARKSVTASAI